MAYTPLSAMPAEQREHYREQNRVRQARYRARHPEEARAVVALTQWKARRRRLAAGWTPDPVRVAAGRKGGRPRKDAASEEVA